MAGIGVHVARYGVLLCVGICLCARAQESSDLLQPLLTEGDSAFAQGNYEAARLSFEKAWQIAQQGPANSPVRYDVLKRLASAGAASGELDAASRYLTQAVNWRESVLGLKDAKIADDLAILVNLYVGMKAFDRALAAAERVQANYARRRLHF